MQWEPFNENLCFFGPRFNYFHQIGIYCTHARTCMWVNVYMCGICANTGYRCSIIQSISPGFKSDREVDEISPPLSSTPPSCKILPELPWGEAEGKRDLEKRGESTTTTAASKSQQPGEGVWVIFYGWRGTTDVHLFISTVSIDVCMCACAHVCARVCVSVCVCLSKFQSEMKSIDKNHTKV